VYKQILYAEWSALRVPVLLLGVLAFALPLLTVTYGGSLEGAPAGRVAQWLFAAQQIGLLIPGYAVLVGVLLGIGAWASDHAGKHVYALSLPVSRARYVWLRFVAGLALLLIPVTALGVGAIVAALSVSLPSGVHAYPLQLTARFLMACLVCYAIFFAISISTRRAALAVLGVIGGLLLADGLLAMMGSQASVTPTVLMWLTNWPGPLSILIGRWALFDV
jgi:ABC-type transport system involved in multi-copper enzyme maturation permease subunit